MTKGEVTDMRATALSLSLSSFRGTSCVTFFRDQDRKWDTERSMSAAVYRFRHACHSPIPDTRDRTPDTRDLTPAPAPDRGRACSPSDVPFPAPISVFFLFTCDER